MYVDIYMYQSYNITKEVNIYLLISIRLLNTVRKKYRIVSESFLTKNFHVY